MFLGLSATGINREVSFSIESANQCLQNKVRCLAIPRLAVMKMAVRLAVVGMLYKEREKIREDDFEYLPSCQTIARGILPSLHHIVTQEEVTFSKDQGTKDVVPDCDINTLGTRGAILPYASDFFCIICHAELCNVYYRCIGCEVLLDKDFIICNRCSTKNDRFHDMVMGLDKDMDLSDIKW